MTLQIPEAFIIPAYLVETFGEKTAKRRKITVEARSDSERKVKISRRRQCKSKDIIAMTAGVL